MGILAVLLYSSTNLGDFYVYGTINMHVSFIIRRRVNKLGGYLLRSRCDTPHPSGEMFIYQSSFLIDDEASCQNCAAHHPHPRDQRA